MEKIDKWLQRPGAYFSTFQLASEFWRLLGIGAMFLSVWTTVAANLSDLNRFGWGIYPIVGLALTAASATAMILVAQAGYYFARWRHLRNQGPQAERVTVTAEVTSKEIDENAQDRLAKITWDRRHRDSSTLNPWEITINLAFTRLAREASCYVRWAELEHYIGAPAAWKWSKQTELLPPQTVHEGRMFDFTIATIPRAPNNKRMIIFGDEISGEQTHARTICIEVTVAATSTKPQKECSYYGLVESPQQIVPVWIQKSRLERIPR